MARIRVRSGKKGKTYQVVYLDPRTGKERCQSFSLRKEAVTYQESISVAGQLHDRDSITISEAVDRWLFVCETVGRRGREPVEKSTIGPYLHHAKVIKRELGGFKLNKINPQICNDFVETLLKNFTRKYAKKILTSFKGMLNQAITDGYLIVSPAETVAIHISGRTTGNDSAAIPSIAEVSQILAMADELAEHKNGAIKLAWKRYRPLFYTMTFSGMRPTEILGLPWKNVDFQDSTIRVTQDANIDGTIGLPKSAASYRTIPMPESAMNILKVWKMACPLSDWDLVFPNGLGKIESHHNITNRGWYVLLKRCGFIDIDAQGKSTYRFPMKSLRHVRASLEIANNANAKEIMALMGHSSVKVTFDIYGHLFPDNHDERAARSNRIADQVLGNNGQKSGKKEKVALKSVS